MFLGNAALFGLFLYVNSNENVDMYQVIESKGNETSTSAYLSSDDAIRVSVLVCILFLRLVQKLISISFYVYIILISFTLSSNFYKYN